MRFTVKRLTTKSPVGQLVKNLLLLDPDSEAHDSMLMPLNCGPLLAVTTTRPVAGRWRTAPGNGGKRRITGYSATGVGSV